MPDYRIEYATLSTEWKFNSILSELPVPGSRGFVALVQKLQPFGLTAQGISLQTPSNNLNDVRLELALLDPRATISIGYSYITLTTGEVYDGDANTILKILQSIFEAMADIDPKIEEGKGMARISLQLPLLDEKIDSFLARYAKKQEGEVDIIPDAAAFIVKGDEASRQARTRVVFAKSVHYENALFCEITWEYESSVVGKPIEFLNRLVVSNLGILNTFDLQDFEEK
jgi:hypothetical protein